MNIKRILISLALLACATAAHAQYMDVTNASPNPTSWGIGCTPNDTTPFAFCSPGAIKQILAPLGGLTVGAPTSRSLSVSTAYQATTSASSAVVTLNLTSSASLSLTSGATNTATVYIGSTSGVATGTGTAIGNYANSLTGTLVVGLNISTSSAQTITFVLPAGWYFAIVPGSGSVTVTSAFDQSLT